MLLTNLKLSPHSLHGYTTSLPRKVGGGGLGGANGGFIIRLFVVPLLLIDIPSLF